MRIKGPWPEEDAKYPVGWIPLADGDSVPAARENVRAHLEKLQREGRAFEENARWRLGRR